MDLNKHPKYSLKKRKQDFLKGGFIQSEMDKCLFMKRDMSSVMYVNDATFAGPDSNAIEEVITGLVVQNKKQRHILKLHDEGKV